MVVEVLRGQKFYDWEVVDCARNMYHDVVQIVLRNPDERKFLVINVTNHFIVRMKGPEELINYIYDSLNNHPDLPYKKQNHIKKHLEGMEHILSQEPAS